MEEIIASVLANAAILAVVLPLFMMAVKTRIEHAVKAEYDVRLESHKAQLKRESDLEVEKQKADATRQLESLKSSLAVVAASRTTAFSNIYERRLNAMAAIYGKLVEVNRRLGEYVSEFELGGSPSKAERHQEVVKAINAFDPSLLEHMLFLPKDLSDRLTALRLEHIKLANRFRTMVQDRTSEKSLELWTQISEYCDGELKTSMEELEAAMRATLDGNDIMHPRIEVRSAPFAA